jgi:phospholipid/cholesterol/gamma-HCH transport system permease protein
MAVDPPAPGSALLSLIENIGRKARAAVAEVGYASRLIASSLHWCIAGWRHGQPVRPQLVLMQMQEIGLGAIPIVAVMAATIGAMLAIQTIYSLRVFGAEYQVTFGVGFSVTREFAPLITAIVVSGRTSSALAARVGMMMINQEVDALRVMGIEPVRYLVAPALLACLVMVPCLTVLNGIVALCAAGVYVQIELGTAFAAYLQDLQAVVKVNDILLGTGKSVIFALLIAVIGIVNGLSVTGGAESVGQRTTRAVVLSIAAIIVADMIFTFLVSR